MYTKKETLEFLTYLKDAAERNLLATKDSDRFNYQRSMLEEIIKADSAEKAYELLSKGKSGTYNSNRCSSDDYLPFKNIYYREDCYDYLIERGFSESDVKKLTRSIATGSFRRNASKLFKDRLSDIFFKWADNTAYLGSRTSIFDEFYREYEEFKYKNKYTLSKETINRIDVDKIYNDKLLHSPETLYAHSILNSNSCTLDEYGNKVGVTDYIAKKLLVTDILDKIKHIDKQSYLISYHDVDTEIDSSEANSEEEKIAIDLYNYHSYNECFLYVADYHISTGNDADADTAATGIIDLVSVEPERKEVYLMKLKTPDSTDSLLSCIAEIYTYFKQVNKVKLTKEIGLKYEFRLTGLYKVFPAIIVFEGSKQHLQFRSKHYKNVQELMLKLGIKFFVIKECRPYFTGQDNHSSSIIETMV